jgi:S1-C subfamily serine protease
VAVLLLPSGSTLTAPISPRSLDISILVTTLSAPPRERPVLVCGFPLGLGFTATQKGAYLSALSRESKPASGLVTLVLPGAESPAVLFLLADPSIQGYSGAPVYLPAGAVVAGSAIGFAFEKSCVGIVSGTISDDTGGKLAAIVPSAFVFEAVELARTKLRRQFHLF